MSQHDWVKLALCRGMDVNFFFPQVGVSYHQTDAIRELCAKCPVQAQCLEVGLDSETEDHGFFGGKSPRERRAINTERRRAARLEVRATSRIPDNESTQTLGMGQQNKTSVA